MLLYPGAGPAAPDALDAAFLLLKKASKTMRLSVIPRVKICCISSLEEARMAIRHGASALGLVSAMPSGPGPISEELIHEIARAAHYCFEHESFEGLIIPTHRKVFWRKSSGHPLRLARVMEGWIKDVTVQWVSGPARQASRQLKQVPADG